MMRLWNDQSPNLASQQRRRVSFAILCGIAGIETRCAGSGRKRTLFGPISIDTPREHESLRMAQFRH
jgi:hypothetical protein